MKAGGNPEGFAFAVLGSADSGIVIEAPDDRADMDRLRREAEEAGEWFYCSTTLGGCGGRLMTVNPTQRHPHFRHYSQTGCTLRDTPETRDRFTHRIIQNALIAWLEQLGYQAKAEQYLDRRSRVDVYAAGAVIEVQLSGESSHSMAKRTERYGGKVTWLFGPHGSITSRDAQLEDEGVVLLVRPVGDQEVSRWLEQRDVEIGVRTCWVPRADDVWVPLRDCTFTPRDGVQLAALSEARAAIATEREAARAAKEQAAAEAAAAAKASLQAAAERSAASRPVRDQSPPGPLIGLFDVHHSPQEVERRARLVAEAAARSAQQPGPRPTVFDQASLDQWETSHGTASVQLRHVVRYHAIQYLDSYPEWIAGTDGRWADGLPPNLIDPAWAVLYRTGVVASGPVASISDLNCDPDGLIIERLADNGLIVISSDAGYDRYESRHVVGGGLRASQRDA